MKREIKLTFGIIFFILGFFLIFNSNITGYVISESTYYIKSILAYSLILGGLILMLSASLEEKAEDRYDAIIIMARNWRGYPKKHRVSPSGRLEIHGSSKMNCAVAADLYKKGEARKIILGSGKTAGERYPSEAEAMRDYLVHKLKVPGKDILTHESNLETYEELDEDIKLAHKNNLKKLALATVETQLPRARKYLGNKVGRYIVSEDYAEGIDKWKRYSEKYSNSWIPKYEFWIKELPLRVLQKIGITKGFTKPIARRVRG